MKIILTFLLALLVFAVSNSNAQNSFAQGFNAATSGNMYASAGSPIVMPGFINTVSSSNSSESEVHAARANSKPFYVTVNSSFVFSAKSFYQPMNTSLLFSQTALPIASSNHYVVEKSMDADNFTQVGVAVVSNNSELAHEYAFIDNDTSSGISYYRLLGIDNENAEALSNIKWVRVYGNNNMVAYPNVTNDNLNIKLNGMELHKISVEGMDGKQYQPNITVTENGFAKLIVSELPAGMYFIMMNSNSSITKIQFLKK